ncbi:MAG: general secretion pathway protein GspB [Piscinibacter sp.]
MSYILDALRRADAERERGGVPGLHTQAMPELGDDEHATRSRGLRPWHWVVLGLAGGLAAALAWQWNGSSETAPPPPAAPAPPPVARAAEPAHAPPPALPGPAPVPPPIAAAPAAAPAVAPAIAPMRATPAPSSPAASAVAGTAAVPAAAEPQRVSSLAALPPEARAGLPALAFGGSIYSNTPANRLLIVNGQLLHEGEALGPGVTLEQIKPKAAVINIRGQRFEVGL